MCLYVLNRLAVPELLVLLKTDIKIQGWFSLKKICPCMGTIVPLFIASTYIYATYYVMINAINYVTIHTSTYIQTYKHSYMHTCI